MQSALPVQPGALVGARYQIESLVGEGGMATVHRAHDRSTGQYVAIKMLSPRLGESRDAMVALFEREFLVLSQLSHPRIVSVYDYGIDAGVPYYTMDLLDGADLQGMGLVPFRRACALGRDVCSALSLVHSRRMVYRDLSPHNVRCTSDGMAKLFDFGALSPMGPSTELIGTLPCIAPEMLAREPLDARTDLYAFGATLYYTLVRQHAYPARSVDELAQLWRQRLRLPSELIPEIPRALDALISDLLEADPQRRPQSAAEVMERLRAIGELEADESLLVKNAYLSKPSLLGREQALKTFQQHALQARHGRGSCLQIVGGSGTGRSRLLETLRVEAQLGGWLVIHTDSVSGDTQHYAGAQALGRALLQAAPGLARAHAEANLSVLAGVVPELLVGRSDVPPAQFESPEARHLKVQPALRQWLAQVARDRPLLVAIDDVQRMDSLSLAFVAILAREARRHRLLIVVTRPDGDGEVVENQHAGATLTKVAQSIVTLPLSIEDTHSLLGSLFGEVPNLELVSRSVYQVTGGNPRDVMALARHLVSEGAARYEAGSWFLPERLSPADLPSSMAEALRHRLLRLTARGRVLSYALSRETALGFSRDDCRSLLGDVSEADIAPVLAELLDAEVLVCSAEQFRCLQKVWVAPLEHVVSALDKRTAHLALSRAFQRRGDGFRQASWLLRAGEHEQGLSVLTDFCVASCARTDGNPAEFHALMQSLPEDWLSTCVEALALYDRSERPPRERFAVLNRMAGLIGTMKHQTECFAPLLALLKQLAHDAGLDYFDGLPLELGPGARIQQALTLAKERYLALPEQARVLDPGAALKGLVTGTVAALGSVASTSDFAALRSLPSLAPVAPLAPGIQLVHQLAQGLGHRLAARTEAALGTYQALLDRLAQPDQAGLSGAHYFYTKTRVMGALGALEAVMGRASCLDWARQIEGVPQYEYVVALIPYLYQLSQNNTREARRLRRRFEQLQLELNASMDMQHVFSELSLYALIADMTGVRRAVEALERTGSQHAAARAALHYGRGEYHRIRGDLPGALVELGQALALMKPGEHVLWANAAGSHVNVLRKLGRLDEARALGEEYLESAAAQELGYVQNYVRWPLSRVFGKLGQYDRAQTLARAAVDACQALQITGVHAELACEALVQVSSQAGDQATVDRHLESCSARFRRVFSRRSGDPGEQLPLDDLVGLSSSFDSHLLATTFATALLECRSISERAATGLGFMTRHLGLNGGAVFLRSEGRLVHVASTGEVDAKEVLQPWALQQLERVEAEQHTAIVTDHVNASTMADSSTDTMRDNRLASELHGYTPILLAHYDETGFAVTGIVALRGQLRSRREEADQLGAELSRKLGEHTQALR